MPELSRFFGIVIVIYYDDHNPPHFHARYNEYKASINIENNSIIEGFLPPRAMWLVIEWALNHKDELLLDWNLIKSGEKPHSIQPL